ncbi:hemagglutinin repeat-containing protein [Achromobacter agilis]|nr:hemagglutinin repeat-containing protein [Achromobacter agilis]
MSKLHSFIVWSVIGTQMWSPVLAQTLPISVDKSVAGQKPVVGVSNGVPVINIAPPSAGGVSNNRYTQFNVGPAGVVLNNSGGASQTQLAGQVAGNVMLGNQRAATILNQVTAPNPSQLMGTLEVAGNRANVIVANPAGITCNGCGFLNADRATLTTGRPQIGPDGSVALDVAAGKIRVEGEGVYGANLSQVDLIARSLEINAGVWADRLNVTAGAARVDYASGAASALAGDGAAPTVALDTAALGGMYANSIRLIGTEAGVGVNVGGNLVALTGDLQVSAAGDVRIAPSATVQAARDLRLAAGRDLALDGVAQAAGAVALAAGRNADVQGAVGAGGSLDVSAAQDVTIAAQAGLQTQDALRIVAVQDLSLAGSMLMGGQDLRAESGRNLQIGPAAATFGGAPPATGGAGQESAAGGGSDAGGSGSNGGASNASGGQVTAAGAIALQAGRDMTLPGRITAAGALQARAGADLAAGASAQLQSGAATVLRAGADLRLGGLVGARGDVSLMTGRDALMSGKGAGAGHVAMAAGRDLRLDAQAQWDAEGAIAAKAGGNMALAGTLRANAGTDIAADDALAIDGALSAASGGLSATAGGDVSVGAQAQVAAAGPIGLTAGGDLRSLGKLTSQKDLSLRAARNLALDGQALATGDLRLDAGEVLAASSASRLQADGSVKADANQASLAGVLIAGHAAQVAIRGNLRVDGTLLADAGTLKAISGGDLTLGNASVLQSGRQLGARAGGKLLADGTISGETDILLSAGTDAELNGKTVANGTLRTEAGADLSVGRAGLAQGSSKLFLGAGRDLHVAGTAGTADTADADGLLQVQAARDLFVTGVVTAGTPASLSAARHMDIDGTVAALAGNLTADAGGRLRVSAAGRMQASRDLAAQSGSDLDSDGVIVAGGGLTLAATGGARLGGTAAALGNTSAGNVELRARDLTVKQGGQVQAAGTLTAQALRDLTAAGALASLQDMALDAARDARVDGTAATDANLTLTGRNVAVGAAGLAQAAGTLTAGAQGTLLAQGRMLAGASQALSAGDGMAVDGTVAALQGDLTLDTLRGNLVLGVASSQQAGGTLAATAGAALQAMGSAAAGQGMTLRAGTDATLGGIAATQAGNLVVNANRNLTATADGRLQAAAALDLQAGAALRNAGILSAAGVANLRAGSTLDNTGSVLAGGDLNAAALGALGNAGRFIAGVGDDGTLSLPGSVKLAAALITHPGISAAGKDLSLAAAGMDLSGGNLSSVGKLALASPGDIATRNAVVHGGALDIAAASLRNQGGKLTSAGDSALKLGGELDNAAGLIAAARGLRIEAARVGNAAGTLAGGDLTVAATGAVDNRGGLIQADESLALNAAALDNSATLAAPGTPAKGVLGKFVAILADRVNNQGGSVGAGQDLTLTTGELDNTGGEIAAQRNATVRAALLKNAQGLLLAGERLAVNIDALQGLGTLQSAQDLSFTYAGSLNQTGNIAAGRDLTLSVGGAMDNGASVSAGRDLSVTADSLNNRATGELLAGRNNTINVTRGLTNAGLIDGASTDINAGRLDNFGRIYGNGISIRAGEIVNGAGAGGGAVIASRGDLDLGAGSLVNREHALIYAGTDLRIGGALDANRKAIGQAVSLLNASAAIEAAGNAAISAATLQNVNTNFVSQVVPVQTVPKLYVTPAGSTDVYDMETNWFCDQVTPMCGKEPAWLDDDPERRFLLPSSKYPASRYGPPFDYVPNKKGRAGKTAPIPVTYSPEIMVCTGGEGGADCKTRPETFFYPYDSRIWAVFGLTPPPGPMPVWTPPQHECFSRETCSAEAARRQAFEEAYAAYKALHLELDARVREFNADFDSRLVGTFTYYQVEETVTETRTVSSDPGKILSGGAMTLTGTATNDKSQIAAGGALNVAGPAIHNIGAGGERVVTRGGTATYTQARSRDRKETSVPYAATLAAQPIELPVGTSGGYASVSLSGGAPGASGGSALGAVLVASIGLPGGSAVRTVSNPAAIPDSQLFAVNGRPDAPYIVATDPRFVGNRPSVSSDYLFDQLRHPGAPVGDAGASGSVNAGLGKQPGGLNALIPVGARFLTPAGQPKRLGDGFYEQKLVADQILATSGQRFLDGYADNDSQYKALLAAGAQFARNNGIQLGVALTEAQQRLLDTDLVWLVEQTVTLPDGTTETVLAPQVYLLVREGDLKGDGALMAGRSVKLAAEGDIANSGTIGARDATVMSAANIVNQAGSLIQGATIDLAARQDLANLVSLIKGGNVSLSAGRDIALASSSASENHGATWGSYVSGVSRVDAGSLSMQAGRDLTLTAAQVTVKDDARLRAGRDITLATLTESHGESIVRNKNNRHDLSTGTEIGSQIAAGGNLTLIAGQDVNARAADVTAGKQLAVGARRDINLTAGVETGSAYDETRYKKKGFLSSKTTHTITSSDWEQSLATTFTGDTAVLMAGRDLTVAGSNVGAQRDLVMSADRDVDTLPGQNAEDSYDYKMVKKSGFGAMGGFSYGSSKQTDSLEGKKAYHNASTVGSVEGDVLINAGNALNIMGSNIIARQDDITLIGKEVNIGAALDTTQEKEFHEIKQTGVSINASTPIVSAMQTAGRMGNAASKTDNKVMQGLALATTGLAAMNAADAVAADPKSAGGVSLNISFGVGKSLSTTDRSSSAVAGSTVAAGNDLTIVARGAGADSDVTVTGSRLSAGNNSLIKAEGDILLQAAQNTFEQHTKSKSASASIGIGVTASSENGVGVMLNIGAGGARGRADGKDTGWAYTDVTAGNVLALQSGGDASLLGAVGQANQIIASVGRDLRIETLQNTSTYDSKQQSAGIQASICIYGYCKSSVSGNVSQGRMNSDFKSATEQAGLKAGDGGFLVDVNRNTALIGAVISSSDQAVVDGLNRFGTGTLVVQDLKNTARYKADQIALSGGYSWGGSGGAESKSGDVGTNSKGQAAGGSEKVPGTSLPTSSNGTSVGMSAIAAASGNANSITHSGVSGGSIVIRDEAGQLALTGKTAAETIASLSRGTSDTLNALKPIFDKEKIEAGFEIASEFQLQAGQFLANRAKEAKALEQALENEPEGPRRDQLQLAFEEAKVWQPGGEMRRWLTAISAAITGNVTGAMGDMVQAAAINYLQGLAASEVKRITTNLGDGAEAEAARAAMHAIVGCAGAAGKGGSCSAGALGAGAGSVINALLSGDQAKLNPEEKEARRNLVESLVAGIALAAGTSVMDATFAAVNETENNALSVPEHQARIQEKTQCNRDKVCEQEVAKKYKEIDDQKRLALTECASPDACREKIEEATMLLDEYSSRVADLEEKLRVEGSLSASEQEEWALLKIHASVLLEADRNAAIKNAIVMGGVATKQLVWDEIAKVGEAGAAAAIGAVGSIRSGKGKVYEGASGQGAKEAVRVFRVEGAPNTRILLGEGGTVGVLENGSTLWLNFGSRARAEEYLGQKVVKGLPEATVKSFEVPKSLLDDIRASAVPESMAKQFPDRPIISRDPAPDQFGLRQDQIKELLEKVIQGTGREGF